MRCYPINIYHSATIVAIYQTVTKLYKLKLKIKKKHTHTYTLASLLEAVISIEEAIARQFCVMACLLSILKTLLKI